LSFLIDTNVASEAAKPRPSPQVRAWFAQQRDGALHFSVCTIGEIDFGIARLEVGPRRVALQAWRDHLVDVSRRRILPVDLRVAETWGIVRARAAAAKRTMPSIDALLAATAEVHGLTLVTRNTRDFEVWGGPVFNPWAEASPPDRSS
jgi:predicted nucleic acid-binding protein